MIRRHPALRFALLLGTLALASSTYGQERTPGREIAAAAELIESLQLVEAERALADLDERHPGSAAVLFHRGLIAFHRGDYESASVLVDQAIALGGAEKDQKRVRLMRDIIHATHALTRDYEQVSSNDRRFVIAYPKGKDEILVPYALEVLTQMDRTLAQVMGKSVPGPIRLEIYPSAQALAQVSPLTLEQIETSGTVALCKWNRLMITSPRALVRGYPWADTIAHELTHLYLSYVTREKAPVWLQEGSAKLLEQRWRARDAGFELDPISRALLERAHRDRKLLTFEQLHPSIALLPSQDDAALAFAQVSTFMNEFVKQHGEQALRDAYELIAGGTDAREALARAANTRFAELERAWRAALPKSGSDRAPRKLARRFRDSQSQTPDESQDVMTSDARRHLRLGDMLWHRKRVRAAMLEYEKAHGADDDDPIVAARLARAALQAGDPARSLAAVEPLLARYPEHAPTQSVRGEALFALGRNAEAHAALIEAVRINPFDPEPHCILARIAQDAERMNAEQRACALLKAP